MSLSTYGGLKAAIADWLNRSDMTARIPDFVTLATATLNKVLRDRRMVVTQDVMLSANPRWLPLPDGVLEMLWVSYLAGGVAPLERVSPERLGELRRTRFRLDGTPRFYAVVGNRLELCPTPPGPSPVELAYYAEIPPLVADGDSNWVLADEPDIYLYTALLHAAQFLHDPMMAQSARVLLDVKIAAAVSVEAKAVEGA